MFVHSEQRQQGIKAKASLRAASMCPYFKGHLSISEKEVATQDFAGLGRVCTPSNTSEDTAVIMNDLPQKLMPRHQAATL